MTVDLIGTTRTETAANLANFMQTNNYTFPVVLDTNKVLLGSYGIVSTPTNFLIDKDGIIRTRQTGAFASQAAFDQLLNPLLPK